MLSSVVAAIEGVPCRAWKEVALQGAIFDALTTAGLSPQREAPVSQGRIDFLVGYVGVEVKVSGRRADVLQQLLRYAADKRVKSLVLATTCLSHARLHHVDLVGVPLHVVTLLGGSL